MTFSGRRKRLKFRARFRPTCITTVTKWRDKSGGRQLLKYLSEHFFCVIIFTLVSENRLYGVWLESFLSVLNCIPEKKFAFAKMGKVSLSTLVSTICLLKKKRNELKPKKRKMLCFATNTKNHLRRLLCPVAAFRKVCLGRESCTSAGFVLYAVEKVCTPICERVKSSCLDCNEQ